MAMERYDSYPALPGPDQERTGRGHIGLCDAFSEIIQNHSPVCCIGIRRFFDRLYLIQNDSERERLMFP
jgi:hypothetical protein